MRSSFLTSASNLGLVPQGVKQNSTDEGGKGGKVAALEAVLRGEQKEKQATFAAPHGTQQPIEGDPRKRALNNSLYYGHDEMFKRYGNELADYNSVSSQVTTINNSAVRALELSTLESKRELARLSRTNNDLNMVASQFGLEVASGRQFKRRKQINRLSAQTLV